MARLRTSSPPRRRGAASFETGPRDRLLAAADELFYSRGIRNVGIDEILAKAGVAKASLYSHFTSKDELVAEYVRRRAGDWGSWFRQAVEARASSPARRLLAVFDVLGEWTAEDTFRGCALQNACVELADTQHAAHRVAVSNKRAVRQYLEELTAAAGARNPRSLADQLFLLVEGAIVTSLLEGSAAPTRTARMAAQSLVRSL